MDILKHFDKNNLHHAYLIEGNKDEILPEVFGFLTTLGVETVGNSDFIHINLDSFKIDDARNLKTHTSQKSFSDKKKVFIISVNSFLLEAQNSLLKLFEEPIENTHFFVIIPDVNVLLNTFASRFYLISSNSARQDLAGFEARQGLAEIKDAEKFLAMPIKNRIDFIKELLSEEEDEDENGNEILATNSPRAKALKFLNALEFTLHKTMSKTVFDTLHTNLFEHIFKVREFLRMPGSSVKSLMESVALIVPNMSNK